MNAGLNIIFLYSNSGRQIFIYAI